MTMTIVSTTDSPEAVSAAMGNLAETKPAAEQPEVPEVEAKPDESETTVEAEAEAEEPSETEENEESEELEESDEEPKEKPKKKGGFQKKLERAEKLRASLEQEKEYWRQEALRKSEAPKEKTETKTQDLSKPKAEDFNTHDEYVEALTEYKLELKLKEREAKQKEDKVKDEFQKKVDAHRERVEKFKADKDDWDEVTEVFNNNKNLTITFQNRVLNSELGPAILYELGKNPKELNRILSLTPEEQAEEIGALKVRLKKSNPPEEKKKITTKAPPPIKPVRTKGAVTPSGYRDDMTLAEFEKWERSQSKARHAGA